MVFVLVTVGTAVAGLRVSAWRGRAVARLASRKDEPAFSLPSPALAWRELIDRIGTSVPGSPKDLPVLKLRLLRAGFRDPGSVRVFRGTRAVLAVAFGLAGLFAVWRANVKFVMVPVFAMAAYMAPGQYLRLRIARRQHAVDRGLPNALDLMVVCVESGLGIDQATIQVSKELRHAHPEICD